MPSAPPCGCRERPLPPAWSPHLPRQPRPYQRRPASHHRVLVALLYSRFGWALRLPDGGLRAPQTQFAKALGLRTHRLRAALATLREQGLLDSLTWHPKGWFQARPATPPGLARCVGDAQLTPTPGDPATAWTATATEVLDV